MSSPRFPLHAAQQDVITDQLINMSSPQYNLGGYIILKGVLHEEKFYETIQSGAKVFDAFRMRFDAEADDFYGYYDESYTEMEISGIDFSDQSREEVKEWMQEKFNTPFRIRKDRPLFEQYLIKIADDEHWYFGRYHHLITDGYGFIVWVNYVAEKYKSLTEGNDIAFNYPSYREAAASSFEYKNSPAYVAEGNYWKQKISEKPGKLLQKKFTGTDQELIKSAGYQLNLTTEDRQLLDQLQATTKVGIQQLTIAALLIYFGKTTSQSDFIFGIPVHKRGSRRLRNMVGMFSGILPNKSTYNGEIILLDLLKEIAAAQKKDYRNQNYLNGDLTRDLKIAAADGYLTEVIINYEPYHFNPDFGEGIDASINRLVNEYDRNPLQLYWRDYSLQHELQLQIHYSTQFFSAEEIDTMAKRLLFILRQFSGKLADKISTIEILSPDEKLLLNQFNDIIEDYPQDKNLIDLFEEQVIKTPEAIATVYEDEILTYRQLNEQSNQLANYLISKGVSKETLVPICLERSNLMIVGILGILKAGGAYVPVDPQYPADRINHMLEDIGASLIICTGESSARLPASNAVIVKLDDDVAFIDKQSINNPKVDLKPNNLAYVIYTSGSTGMPKGAMNEHGAVVNRLLWAKDYFEADSSDSILQKTTFSFDVSVWELLLPIISGAKLIFAKPEGHKDNDYLLSTIDTAQITMLHFVPSMLGNFLPDVQAGNIKSLRKVLCSGEALKPWQVELFKEKLPDVELHNLYGPTEAAIDVTCWTVPENIDDLSIVPIGKPVANTTIYILGKENELLPVGATGEIFIGGTQVGRGYFNRPELTAEKFIGDHISNENGAKLYKTGDLGRWLPDGNIEYLGRNDEQVKIRGYRIEPGEIESTILKSEMVNQVAVIAKEDQLGHKRLVGYIVPAAGYKRSVLIAWLDGKLPGYMVPALWVELTEIPLTSNGKLNRKLLPEPGQDERSATAHMPPLSEAEKDLCIIWEELLGLEKVGIKDNFFQIGGDSLITLQLVSRARKLGYNFQPKDVFYCQTIEKLATIIKNKTDNRPDAEQEVLQGESGLLPIQQWYFEKKTKGVDGFNQSILLNIDKSITEKVLNQSFNALLAHHDALRFNYRQDDSEWKQQYNDKKLVVDTEILQSADETSEIVSIANHHHQNINIEAGELVKFVLIKTGESTSANRLLIIIHHLLIDGVSWRILLEDLATIIGAVSNGSAISLPAKTTSYRQWYNALLTFGKRKKVLAQKDYWVKAIAAYQPLIKVNNFKEAITDKDTSEHHSALAANLTKQLLQEVPGVYHTEINDILIAALANTICNWNGSNKLVVGVEGHGREDISEKTDVSRTFGWFTSLYPAQINLDGSSLTSDLIKTVKEQLRKIPGKGLGFGILKYINNEPSLQGKDPWDILFNYLGQFDKSNNTAGSISVAAVSPGAGLSADQLINEKISLNCFVQDGQLKMSWTFSNFHFDANTIKLITESYLANLQSLIEHCVEQGKQAEVFTPTDYGLGNEVNFKDLDHFLDEVIDGKERRENIDGIYRLSALQQGMLFHGLFDKTNGTYINQFSCELIKPDKEIVIKSWEQVLKSHSILRSAFYHDIFSVPVQVVYNEVKLPVQSLDFSAMPAPEKATAINQFETQDRRKGFDFKAIPLTRITLLRLSEDRYQMVWTSHHIIFDGWSWPILIEEFLSNYDRLSNGEKLVIAKEDRYEDYIRYIERSDKEDQQEFWRQYLEGISEPTLLPFIATNAERTKGLGKYETISLTLSTDDTNNVRQYAQNNRLTTNTIIQGVWALLLHHYTNQNNVVYGVIESGRPDDFDGVEQRVGMYINTLPFHAYVENEADAAKWLHNIQQQQLSSRKYQHTALQDIQSWVGIQGDFFDSLLVFLNYPVSKIVKSGKWKLQVENFHLNEQNNFPLTITASNNEVLNIAFTYNADLIEGRYINSLKDHFNYVLLQLVADDQVNVGNINLLTAAEKQQLLVEFNNTSVVGSNENIVSRFEKQVVKTPTALALVFAEQELSFESLNKKSNQLAHYLVTKGVAENTLVPVCLDRSIEMIIGILGVIKAGGAYVPIDPSFPTERIKYILDDCKASMVLSRKAAIQKFDSIDISIIDLDDNALFINQPTENLSVAITGEQLAYIIYTSGSTGNPKGVMIRHENIAHYITNSKIEYVDAASSNAGSFMHLSYTFDASLTAIFMPLLKGKSIVLASKDSINIFEDENLLKYAPYDFIKLTPAHLELLQPKMELPGGKLLTSTLVVGGEALHLSHVEYLSGKKLNVAIVNEYGPTEATVGCSTYTFNTAENNEALENGIPIGKPIDNTQLYIVNEKNVLVSIGVAGEICIGGAGVAKGYLNRPDLTSEKFIANSFGNDEGDIIYNTGDLGRWLPDGNIEYLGRKDSQVKIRGYRIELGEIENVLQQSELVKQAVVLTIGENNDNRRLVAYIVPEGYFEKEEIEAYLSNKLPGYMVPSLLMELETLPLTSNGKIDRKALASRDIDELLVHQFVAAGNETEEKLTEIWQYLLEIDQVGINDDFFELGGHSLLAVRMIAAIRKKFGVELSINEMFDYPTIAVMAAKLQSLTQQEVQPAISGIQIQARPARIPLSFSQERLWFIHQLEGSLQYHVPAVLGLKGKLNKEGLTHSLKEIINRHEILRTVIMQEDGQGYQLVLNAANWQLDIKEGATFSDDKKALQQYINQLIKKPFDLSKDYLMRATLINLSEAENIMVVTMHHIASDAWSMSILVKEVVELYSAFDEGRAAQLAPMQLQYADFAIWQRQHLQGSVVNEKINYWKNKLDDVAALQLPVDFARPVIRGSHGAALKSAVDKQLTAQLQELSQQQGATLFMVLLTVFKTLMYRYSGQQDISVGTSIGNRPQQELESLVGFFVNTLALRSSVEGDLKFTDLLKQVKTTTLEAYQHQEVPFEKVVEAVVKERDASRSPLFQVMLVLLNTPEVTELRFGDVELTNETFTSNISKFDITFFVNETSNGLEISVEYSTDLYRSSTIERMMEHFNQLLQSVVKAPEQKIGLLPMLTPTEQHQLQHGWNKATVDYPTNASIAGLFTEQAIKTPEATAIVFEENKLTYKELNERANQLANYLVKKGVKANTLVPLFIDRSTDMLVAMVGILKAGAAYVPIDTAFPSERISYMLEDTDAKLIVSSIKGSDQLKSIIGDDVEIIELDSINLILNGQPNTDPAIKILPQDTAYLIYTSGSTGKPKGVMVTHQNLGDYVFGLDKQIGIGTCKTYALVSTIATDLGNTVIFSSLLLGGALHVFSKESVSNAAVLQEYFSDNKIDCLKIVPSHWKALSQDDELLIPKKLLIFGGEALPAEVVTSIYQTGTACTIVNHYGPTETTIGKLLHITKRENSYSGIIPIGKPFSNTQVYILSKELQLCPAGVPGQLYIAGDGVAKGYLNNEALTKEKFIQNPFASNSESKMYATGDLVKYQEDGNIMFLGRVDDQVKIRGYRVELGEIENVLQQSAQVSQAVVLAKEDKQGTKRLVAYIVPDGYFEREAIVAYLNEQLPEYMVPGILVELVSLPLTANGKIDRKALPDPDASEQLVDQYVAPRNEAEHQLATIWEDVLEVDQVGVNDDFFELGGHSLLAIRLISAIRKEMDIEIPISDVFDYPTVAALAARFNKNTHTDILPPITKVDQRPSDIPLSFSQERLWFIDQMDGSIQYHVPAVLKLSGTLNVKAMAAALNEVVNRHEVLRTVMVAKEGQPFQVIKEKDKWELALIDGTIYKNDDADLQHYIQEILQQPFDLSKDYMLRGHLINVGSDENYLVINIHHIASDGWSRSVLVKELVALYETFDNNRPAPLPEMALQYVDYSIWQRTYLSGETLQQKLGYWKNNLDGVATLELPTDFVRPAIQTVSGSIRNFEIDNKLSAGIREFCQQQGTTLYMTLLSVFNVLLHRYSGQEDICVGTGIAGRQQKELEGLIGFFINTLAMRNTVSGDLSFKEFLQQVKQTTLNAYTHQEVPFEKVVDAVVRDRDLSRNPIFQVTFIVQNVPDFPELKFGNVKIAVEKDDHLTSKFDITFSLKEKGNILEGLVEYNSDLYRAETIDRMMAHFQQLIVSVIEHPNQKIDQLQMLTAKELQDLLSVATSTLTVTSHTSILTKFAAQVSKTPDATALLFEEETLTFRELDQRSTQLANYLKTVGVKPEQLIPICIERRPAMIVGILGILKAGAAYVPIDQEYPLERIRFILEDTQATIALSSSMSRAKISSQQGLQIIEIDSDWDLIGKQDEVLNTDDITPDQLAYIIYTSGSTGLPKGVMVEHVSVVNLINAQTTYFNITADERILQFSNYCFDASVEQIFLALFNGATLVLYPEGLQYNIEGFENFLKQQEVTHLHATPFFLENINPDNFKHLKRVIAGGDKCRKELVDKWKDKCDFYNEYGPTETTVTAVEYHYSENDNKLDIVPIGKPLANVSAYVLDKNGMLCPEGIPGELYLGGVQVARGYLNRQALTEERFVTNKFSDDGGRLYRTGDLVKMLPNGNLEFLGRIDDQVKIHGYRIELGEIETVLNALEPVENSCIVVKYHEGNANRLVGYFVPKPTVVKEKEHELYRRQVESWKAIHENEYVLAEAGQQDLSDPEFNILGWNDSFTRKLIGEAPMREWLNDIINVVMQDQPQHVLEIGCGSGLIYYPLADKIKKYIGTDFSRNSINQITERIGQGERNYCPTELKVCAAHEIELDANEEIDTIIINSVVQYFPGGDYLGTVIEKGIAALKGKGRIIIGDVRDNRLLHAFRARLLLQKLQGNVSVKEFNWAVDQEVLNEEELCFDPEYFYGLKQLYPQITNVAIQWKQGDFVNELTMYRFTVVIHLGIDKPMLEPKWQSWEDGDTRQVILQKMQDKYKTLALKDVPNPRLWKEKLLKESLVDSTINDVDDINEALKVTGEESVQVLEMLRLATSNGYQYRLLLDEDPLKINLLFELNPSDHFIANVFGEKPIANSLSKTNIPLFADISLLLQKDIKLLLLEKLTEYMVPAEWVALSKLPLTINGKLDRKFLSQREDRIIANQLNYEPPRNEIEEKIAAIWAEFLHLEKVGIYDNFFELGGHSLMAMRVISAIRKELHREVTIKDLFIYPTIAELAVFLSLENSGVLLPGIGIANRPEKIPLSYSQERLWFIDRLSGSVQYHMPSVLRLKGQINIAALNYALTRIIARHEILRTIILETDGKAYQKVLEAGDFNFHVIDGTNYNEDELKRFIQDLINMPFDFSKDPMLRGAIVKINDQEHILVVTMHHIASDGWSVFIMVKELLGLYESYVINQSEKLAPLLVQYADYAIWQRTYLQGEVLEKKVAYWKQKLDGVATVELPLDFSRPAVWSGRGAIARFDINKTVAGSLYLLCQQQGTTLFMTLVAALKIILHKYAGQQDISIGTPVANRATSEVEGLVGFFVNMLPLRSQVDNNLSITEFLHQVKQTTLDAFEHQDVPFEKIVNAVVKERDLNRNPLFQVVLVLLNTPDVPTLKLENLTLTPVEPEHTGTLFDLSFFVKETSTGLQCWVEYCTDLFKEETIVQLIGNYQEMLLNIVNTPGQKIGEISILTRAEQRKLLTDFNNNITTYPVDKSIVQLFEEQAIKTPDAIAIVFEDESMTYRQLNEKANQLAHFLKTKKVASEVFVPLFIERSLEMMIAILGILKTGGAYVPLNTQYPRNRIRFMLDDISAKIILTGGTSNNAIAHQDNLEIVDIVNDWHLMSNQSKENLLLSITPLQLAYVIYTSGSTGTPKGVMVEHRNVVSLVKDVDYVSFSDQDVLLSTGASSFDATTFEYWGMLLNGGKLILCREERLLENELLKEEINKHDVTKMWFTSSWFNQLVDADISVFQNLQTLLVGGEKLSEKHIEKMRRAYPHIDIINGYGPTENTTFSLTYHVKEEEIDAAIQIGRPLSNRFAYVLDQQRMPVPIGVSGEIYLAGAGLSRGYLNNKILTEQKFVTNPFSSSANAKMYKTGDLGCWSADGNIHFQGRVDDQVKIRGFRIEPGEIETVLGLHHDVKQCVVIASEDQTGKKRLVAYVVPEGSFEKEILVTYLKDKLPDYMVPAIWMELNQLPLTANGKVDKRALPKPDASKAVSIGYEAPRNAVEEKLAEIWQELLELDRIGIHDNFFELGGDSIMAIQLVSRSRNAGFEMIVANIFSFQTIAQIASWVEKGKGKKAIDICEQDQLKGNAGLLPIQQWYFEKEHTSISHFNQSVLLSIDKSVDESVLQQALDQIVLHHDALGFKYTNNKGEWQQEYGTVKKVFNTKDLSEAGEGTMEAGLKEAIGTIQKSLDIEKGEMIKAALIKTPASQKANRLFIVVHHLAVDGVSWRILLQDLEEILAQVIAGNKVAAKPKSSSYRQWYEALVNYGKTDRLKNQFPYWQNAANAFEPLPVDSSFDKPVQLKDTSGFSVKLGASFTKNLIQEVPGVYHTEINDILLSALAKTFAGWSKNEQLVIGLEGHGREHITDTIDLTNTVGWFTTLYPLHLNIAGSKDMGAIIKSVKEQVRKVPDKGLGYGVIKYINKENLAKEREPWDIQFNYLGQLDNVVRESKWLSIAKEDNGEGRSEEQIVNEKISVTGHILGGELILNWNFSGKHYQEKTIRALANSYIEQLKLIIEHCISVMKSGTAIYTPSDYGLGSDISYEELDSFMEEDDSDNILSF